VLGDERDTMKLVCTENLIQVLDLAGRCHAGCDKFATIPEPAKMTSYDVPYPLALRSDII
jgi:hypothetical protein